MDESWETITNRAPNRGMEAAGRVWKMDDGGLEAD